jgi:hypothetical protein
MADPHLVPVHEHDAQRAKFTNDLVCDHEEVVGFKHVVHTGPADPTDAASTRQSPTLVRASGIESLTGAPPNSMSGRGPVIVQRAMDPRVGTDDRTDDPARGCDSVPQDLVAVLRPV